MKTQIHSAKSLALTQGLSSSKMIHQIKLFHSLTKPRIYIAIAITGLMGLVLQSGFSSYSIWISISLLISTILASAGSAAFNHYIERDSDRLMDRTKNRPLVTGAIASPKQALWFAWGLTVAGLGLCYVTLGAISAFWLAMGFITYVVIYTMWLKHSSLWNVTIGGLSSSFAILAGDTAITGEITMGGFALATLLFFWNPAHFWNLSVRLQDDFGKAKIPTLSLVIGERNTVWAILAHVVGVIASSIWLGMITELGSVYMSVAVFSGAALLLLNVQNLSELSRGKFLRNFISSHMYLLILFVGIGLDLALNSFLK